MKFSCLKLRVGVKKSTFCGNFCDVGLWSCLPPVCKRWAKSIWVLFTKLQDPVNRTAQITKFFIKCKPKSGRELRGFQTCPQIVVFFTLFLKGLNKAMFGQVQMFSFVCRGFVQIFRNHCNRETKKIIPTKRFGYFSFQYGFGYKLIILNPEVSNFKTARI